MENYRDQTSSLFDMVLDEPSQQYLEQGAKWAKFLSIVFIVGGTLAILVLGLFGSYLISSLSPLLYYGNMGGSWIMMIVVLFLALIFGVFIFFLYRFAHFTSKGVSESSQESIEKGVGSLKVYFVLVGLLGILGLLSSLIKLATFQSL